MAKDTGRGLLTLAQMLVVALAGGWAVAGQTPATVLAYATVVAWLVLRTVTPSKRWPVAVSALAGALGAIFATILGA